MFRPDFKLALLHLRFWPTWLGLGVARALCLLPIDWQLGLGSFIGRSLGRVMKSRRHIVRTNLHLCFPTRSAEEIEQLCDEHFAAIGAGGFEACMAWWVSDRRLAPRGEVRGIEHLRAAQARGQGALLLTGHFTTLEIAARYLCIAGVPFHAMYRPYNNAVLDFYMHRWREQRSGLPALPRDELRTLVKALRRGQSIWYAPDQTLDRRISVFAPFFGIPASTITATARLAQMGRAAVVPFFCARENGRYIVTIRPALENFPSDDELADATTINRVIEDGIRDALPQYFWIHRRFKHRPDGEASLY
ncbi:MAG: LpxL/LpxP family Kdo(2)-lipid IV(A) lauroyl/palmitoleoyl acyltransferase [Pseudomonadota bacterium]|nr:LpxL/LpxP family Kdo(2)-lipid IV(A) lauroyl/palmitoleoyl acyltransferase [Pseudomonadota bacterium]